MKTLTEVQKKEEIMRLNKHHLKRVIKRTITEEEEYLR